MHPNFFSKTHLTKFLTVLLLIVALTSCGTQNQPAASSTSTPTSSSSSSLTSNQNDSLSLNKTGVAIDEGGLHIQVSNGVECPAGVLSTGQPDKPDFPSGAPLPGNNLVLATNRLTYDSNEIQQIQNYVKSTFTGGSNQPVPLPNTLRWVLGGPTDTTRIFPFTDFTTYMYDCTIDYQITNSSQNVVQIASVGVQLTASPKLNTYHYRLLDVCSIANEICQEFGGGPGTCSEYYTTIKLDATSGNSVFSASPVGYDTSCQELTLNPGDTKGLFVYIYSPQNMIYSAVPQLTLDTSSGPNTLTLSDLSSTLAFASNSQFTCYGLQGDTFVVETPPSPNVLCI